MRKRIYKDDHPNIAGSMSNLSYAYYLNHQYSEAENLFKEAIDMYKRTLKNKNLNLAKTIINLAMFYENLEKYNLSETLYFEAL